MCVMAGEEEGLRVTELSIKKQLKVEWPWLKCPDVQGPATAPLSYSFYVTYSPLFEALRDLKISEYQHYMACGITSGNYWQVRQVMNL